MEEEDMSGTMALATMESGSRTKSTELDSTFGQMVGSTMANGETTICTVMEFILGRMVVNMRATI